jgi:hypothetical protein
MKARKLGLGILGALIMAALVLSAGCKKKEAAPEPEAKPVAEKVKPETAPGSTVAAGATVSEIKSVGKPENPEDPAMFIFYSVGQPTAGKELKTLDLKAGQEITVSVQALTSKGLDTGACPVEWVPSAGTLSATPVKESCKAAKVKALKAGEATLTMVYKGAKGDKIEISLKGAVK